MYARRKAAMAAAAWLALVVASAPAFAQAGNANAQQPPTVAQATARLQAQDAAGAVKILDAVVAREPENVMAWRTLGVALTQTKEYDRALTALQKALELQPGTPIVFYNIGAVYALQVYFC
jgi:Flp pilus assembly protein TadD